MLADTNMDATQNNGTLSPATIAAANALPPVGEWPPFEEFWPLARYGRRVNPSHPPHRCVGYRMHGKGVLGVRLLAINIPGRGKCSCDAWLARFLQAVAQAEALVRGDETPSQRRTPRRAVSAAASGERNRRTDAVLRRHGLGPAHGQDA